jgi:hypothetical protein
MKSSGQADVTALNVDAKTFTPKASHNSRPKDSHISKQISNSDKRGQGHQGQNYHQNRRGGGSSTKDTNRHGRNASHLVSFNYSTTPSSPKPFRVPTRNTKKQSSYKPGSKSNFLYAR